MSRKKLTQEEKVLMAIVAAPQGIAIDAIGKSLGLTDKSFRHAIRLLLHGNFIAQDGPNAVHVTAHGKKLYSIIAEQ